MGDLVTSILHKTDGCLLSSGTRVVRIWITVFPSGLGRFTATDSRASNPTLHIASLRTPNTNDGRRWRQITDMRKSEKWGMTVTRLKVAVAPHVLLAGVFARSG